VHLSFIILVTITSIFIIITHILGFVIFIIALHILSFIILIILDSIFIIALYFLS
jgi:hypothetical protein